MKIVYVGTRLQVNGATKVAIKHCDILHELGHQVRFVVLGASSLDWGKPIIKLEYVTSFRRVKIEEQELIITLDCFSANWFTQQFGIKRVISLIQTDEPKLYTDLSLIKTAETAFMLRNPKVVVSRYLQDVLRGYGSDSVIIPPAADRSIFYAEKKISPNGRKPFRVLTVGNYGHPLKQIPESFKAVEYLQHLGIMVELVRLTRKPEDNKPINIDTEWHVDPPQQEIGRIYRSVDVVLSSSSSEGFGLPILEAMMSGIPFVTTDNGGSRDFISIHEEKRLIAVGDTKAMGEALYQLAVDKECWTKLRESGLENAKNWSWEKAGNELDKYLKSIYKIAF